MEGENISVIGVVPVVSVRKIYNHHINNVIYDLDMMDEQVDRICGWDGCLE